MFAPLPWITTVFLSLCCLPAVGCVAAQHQPVFSLPMSPNQNEIHHLITALPNVQWEKQARAHHMYHLTQLATHCVFLAPIRNQIAKLPQSCKTCGYCTANALLSSPTHCCLDSRTGVPMRDSESRRCKRSLSDRGCHAPITRRDMVCDPAVGARQHRNGRINCGSCAKWCA